MSFRLLRVLKGATNKEKGQEILLCNDPDEPESYDLRRLKTNYFVFASKCGDCYGPVYGLRSVIKVVAGNAETFAVKDQPTSQALEGFTNKIRLEAR